jgi:hypothetical protein
MMGSIGMTTGLVGYCLYLVRRVTNKSNSWSNISDTMAKRG